jgi:AcrR family transcriptional regulator
MTRNVLARTPDGPRRRDTRRIARNLFKEPGTPGRPRSDSAEAAIEAAVRSILVHDGYARLTMDRVAAVAKVGKSTIYRRWIDKADMVSDLMSRQQLSMVRFPDTGSIRDDLRSHLLSVVEALRDEQGAMIVSLLSEFARDPGLAEGFIGRSVTAYRRNFRDLVERGMVRGELRPGLDADVVTDLLVGALYHRLLTGPTELHPGLVDAYLEVFFDGAGIGTAPSRYPPNAR